MQERQAVLITGNGQIIVQSQPLPPLQDGYALVKTYCSLISPGTEINMIKQRRANPQADAKATAFGYSTAGEILEVHSHAPHLKPGMRVAAMGGNANHANYNCVPVNLLHPIPGEVSFEEACFACLGATSLQAVRRTVPQLGEYGAVLGLGIVGNLAAQLAQLSGARVIAWEGLPLRIEIAHQCNIANCINIKETDVVKATEAFAMPIGIEFGIMAFGGDGNQAFQSLYQCMQLSADGHRMGRITLVGGCSVTIRGGASLGNLDVRSAARTGPGYHDEAYELGRDYPAAFVPFTTQRNLREVITLTAEQRLKMKPMITHRFGLAQAGEAVDMLLQAPDRTLGVILKMPH